MIDDDRQYAITRERAVRFRHAVEELCRTPGPGDAYGLEMRGIMVRAHESLLEDLEEQVSEYETRLASRIPGVEVPT